MRTRRSTLLTKPARVGVRAPRSPNIGKEMHATEAAMSRVAHRTSGRPASSDYRPSNPRRLPYRPPVSPSGYHNTHLPAASPSAPLHQSSAVPAHPDPSLQLPCPIPSAGHPTDSLATGTMISIKSTVVHTRAVAREAGDPVLNAQPSRAELTRACRGERDCVSHRRAQYMAYRIMDWAPMDFYPHVGTNRLSSPMLQSLRRVSSCLRRAREA